VTGRGLVISLGLLALGRGMPLSTRLVLFLVMSWPGVGSWNRCLGGMYSCRR